MAMLIVFFCKFAKGPKKYNPLTLLCHLSPIRPPAVPPNRTCILFTSSQLISVILAYWNSSLDKSQPTKCTLFCLKYLLRYNTQTSYTFQSARDHQKGTRIKSRHKLILFPLRWSPTDWNVISIEYCVFCWLSDMNWSSTMQGINNSSRPKFQIWYPFSII